jgi:circadian clock protein KaiC
MSELQLIQKLETGIEGFDYIANGGLPINRTTLISGTAGSAKTVFATQFLAEGIDKFGQPGVFITFEESPDDIRANMLSMGWNITQWEKENKWAFVDASPKPGNEAMVVGEYDLGALLARIEYAVTKIGAKRVSLDSLGAIFTRFSEKTIIRQELFRITTALKAMQVTAILTAERTEEYGSIARYGVEEFVTDNVVILRNPLDQEKRRRTIEILKFRGTMHHKGQYSFTIIPDRGIVVIPLAAIELKQRSSNIRITGGNEELDNMSGGGFFRDSIILVSGATGTGKTLMTTEFLKGGASNGERALLLAFEESREQLFRNAIGWGVDYEQLEKEGLLKVVCEYPETSGLEDHLLKIKKLVAEYKPNRVAVDSLSALERVSSVRGFREFVIGLTSFIKHAEIAGLFTATTPTLMGGESVTEEHISTLTDSIILLRYVEMYGEMRRGITILKMRGSRHDKDIREFVIDKNGMHIGKPFRNVFGILTGNPVYVNADRPDRLTNMFLEE